MPPPLATLITLCFCAYMLRREQRLHPTTRGDIWLPLIWMFFLCSRFPAQWLAVFGVSGGFFAPSFDGSPLDAIIFLLLTVLGAKVLQRRGYRLADFIHDNRWIAFFLLYCLLSALWSDMPFVSLKRWIKILGHPVMALVILTQPEPIEAIRSVFRRAAILLLPLSILVIKYYPNISRSYDAWTGIPFISGLTTMKNSLGAVCLLYALFLAWDVMLTWKMPRGRVRTAQLITSGGLFTLAIYLLHLARSATSNACLMLGIATLLVLATGWVNPRYIGGALIATLIVAWASESLFGIYEVAITALGRNTTLTDRTDLWKLVFSMPHNVMFGAGFEMYWTGERVQRIAAIMGWLPNQAHNGYIETYLNLGAIGLFLLCGWIVAAFQKTRVALLKDFYLGQFQLAFFLVILAYNYTEAGFKALQPIWTMFFLISIGCESYRWRRRSNAKAVIPRDGAVVYTEAGWGLPAGRSGAAV